jgi:subtilisin family serine protease
LITVYVRFFDNVPIAEQRQILTSYGVLSVDQLESFNDQWRVTLPDANLDNLTDDRQVQWVEELEQAPADDMDAARPAIDLPNNYPNGGDGTVIAQWEICHPANGAPDEHPDLANRASLGFASRICNALPPVGALPDNDHATQVAGIMIGDGSAGDPAGQLRGIAPQSQLVSYSVADQDAYGFISEYLDAARHGAIVSSNSWGPTADDYYHRPLSNEYPLRSAFFDMISSLRNSGGWPAGPGHRILIVASSGNRGNDKVDPSNANSARIYWRTTRVRNAAKNVLTIGNVASDQGDAVGWPAFDTGRGPTRDGRIKPDLVAPGSEIKDGAAMADKGINAPVYPTGIVQPKPQDYYDSSWGTSFSTPIVSGAAALLATTIREGTCNRNPTPAELRALLINTAKDLTDASNEAGQSDPILSAQNNDYVLDSPPDGVRSIAASLNIQ